MRSRNFHMALDAPLTWGVAAGFGLHERETAWAQAPDWWQLLIVAFGGVLTVNGTPVPFPIGSALVVPPSSRCLLERTSGCDVSQYWLKFRPDPNGKCLMAVPQVKGLGGDYAHFDEVFRSSLDFLSFSRVRVEIMAWSLLWQISEPAAAAPEDPVVGQVEALIKSNLSQQITTQALARTAGVSVGVLTKLFVNHFGQTPSDYMRTLRMHRSCALLVNTDRPIKEIAARVGYTDLQRFNKVVRETFGCSLRKLREERPDLGLFVTAADDRYRVTTFSNRNRPNI